jgi:large subunit ribosomal protein L5
MTTQEAVKTKITKEIESKGSKSLQQKNGITLRLFEKYKNEIIPYIKESFGLKNTLQVPRLEKIVINMGIGKAKENKNFMDQMINDLSLITGQKPLVVKAKKSVAGFKLRKGMEVGLKVTLRRKRMYAFLDRLISVAIPRIRDFRGYSIKSFDPFGNYNFGLPEQHIFPEVPREKSEFSNGMDIAIVFNTNGIKKELKKRVCYEILSKLGFPFKKDEKWQD